MASFFPAAAASRKALADYPVHASAADYDIGVEYTVHSYSGNGDSSGGQMYLARDFLVFEIAIFPKHAADAPLELRDGAFAISINQSKKPIPQIPPEVVAQSVRQPDWTTHPHLEAGGGLGDVGINVGGAPRTERFPGDPGARSPGPKPPHAPDDETNPRKPQVDAGQLAIDSALLPGVLAAPRSGNIYFPYSGNAARIRHLVLHAAPGGEPLDITIR